MALPNIEGTTNINTLTGGTAGVKIKDYTTSLAPVATVAGVMYYDSTLGNLMISDANGVYHKIVNA